jgi:oleandomycin transport system ATP-binding protein
MDYAIQARGLVKRFGKTLALDGIDLDVGRGTVLGLLGPNGAGKSTIVRVLATLIRPNAGEATVGGYDILKEPDQVRGLVGLTGQYAAIDDDLTGLENLILVGRLLEIPRQVATRRARELLERFGLADAGSRLARTYSGGMRRRLDLAACLVGDPEILCLDEPTAGLDPRSRGQLWDMIRELAKNGATVLLTTQYLEEADELAQEIVVVDHGRVVAHGTSDELKAEVGQQMIEVRPTDRSRMAEVVSLLRRICGAEPATSPEGGTVTAPANSRGMLAGVMQQLDNLDIAASEVSLRLPSLDEVFLSLTGHSS